MSEDSLEWYGGVLAAPARSGWRTVLDVIGVLDLIAAAVLAAVSLTQHGTGTVLGCQVLTPPGGSEQVAVAFSPDGRTLATVGWRDGRTYLWDVATGRLTATLSNPFTGGAGRRSRSARTAPPWRLSTATMASTCGMSPPIA
jgi:hypothetical protein